MRAPSFVAAGLAALSLLATPPNKAFAEDPPKQIAGKCVPGQEPPCYLTMEHYNALQAQIEAQTKLIDKLKAQLAADKEAAAAGDAGANARIAVIEAEIAAGQARLAALENAAREAKASPGSVQWSVMARAKGAVGTPSDKTAVPVDVDAAVGYRDGKTGLGAELGAGGGGWVTDGKFPPALHVRGAFTGMWPVGGDVDLGFGLGGEYGYLGNPNGDGGYGLGTVGADMRLKIGGFCARAGVDLPVHSDLARTSGVFVGGGLGYCGESERK